MKTPEFYLDEVAKERGHDNANGYFMSHFAKQNMSLVIEAMLRHSKEACEEQRKLCADVAKMTCDGDPDMLDGHRCNYGEYVVNKQSILNAKSPIE